MLVQEEAVEQHVHAQQPFARERDAVRRVLGEIAVGLDRLPRRRKALADVDAELLREVGRPDRCRA